MTRENETLGEDLRGAMRHFPSGVSVVTSGTGEDAEGMTASAILSVSLDPPLMLVSVQKDARLAPKIESERYFAINILAADQEGLSRLFASPERSSGTAAVHSLGGGEEFVGRTGAPLSRDALASIECELSDVHPGGDHLLFIGRVVAVHNSESNRYPLVYHDGGYPNLVSGDSSDDNNAFMDSARGYDARVQGFGRRRSKKHD